MEKKKQMNIEDMKALIYHNMFSDTLQKCVDYESLSARIKLKITMLISNLMEMDEKFSA